MSSACLLSVELEYTCIFVSQIQLNLLKLKQDEIFASF